MILINFMGGLGNQLFQYAVGRRLAAKHTTPLKFDVAWYQKQTLRSYQLDAFNIQAEIASVDEIKKFRRADWDGLKARVYQAVQRRLPYYYRRVVVENTPFIFDPNIVNKVSRDVYLIRYWQNCSYLIPIASNLRQELTLRETPTPAFLAWREKIIRQESTSLHIRRGDYVNDLLINQVHGVCPLTYYSDAIDYIRQRVPETTIFVFSDDMDWAREKFDNDPRYEFVELKETSRDQEELVLMSLCDHHIIANSSYSWWGAWLGDKPGKIVIAPQKWFNDTKRNTQDLIPDTWIRL
jgi:hypothetical protein